MQSGWALGYMMASISAAIILGSPSLGADAWRWLFVVGVVAGVLHALDPALRPRARDAGRPSEATAGTRTRIPSPSSSGRRCSAARCCIIVLGSAMQFANWGVFFWLPPFLARPVEQGGAGMGVVGSLRRGSSRCSSAPTSATSRSASSPTGIGRRNTFILFMVAAAVLVPIYGQMARNPLVLLATRARRSATSAAGTSACSAASSPSCSRPPCARPARERATTSDGWRARLRPTRSASSPPARHRHRSRASLTSAFFLLAAALIFTLPDRSGQALDA